MLDRVLKLIVTLTLLLFLIKAVIGVLAAALRGLLSSVGDFFSHVLFALIVLCFLIGLLIRGVQFVANRDLGSARERASRDRAVRQRVRRPAEDVPPVERAEVLEDPDPAIGEEEQNR